MTQKLLDPDVNIPSLIDKYLSEKTSLNEETVVRFVLYSVTFLDPLYGMDARAEEDVRRRVGIILTDREKAGRLRMVRETSTAGRVYEIVE